MIKYANVQECEGFFEPFREHLVGTAGFAYPTRMVMRKDHSRGVALERSLDHLPRIYRTPVNRTGEYLLEAKNAVSGIKEEAAEDARARRSRRDLLFTEETVCIPRMLL